MATKDRRKGKQSQEANAAEESRDKIENDGTPTPTPNSHITKFRVLLGKKFLVHFLLMESNHGSGTDAATPVMPSDVFHQPGSVDRHHDVDQDVDHDLQEDDIHYGAGYLGSLQPKCDDEGEHSKPIDKIPKKPVGPFKVVVVPGKPAFSSGMDVVVIIVNVRVKIRSLVIVDLVNGVVLGLEEVAGPTQDEIYPEGHRRDESKYAVGHGQKVLGSPTPSQLRHYPDQAKDGQDDGDILEGYVNRKPSWQPKKIPTPHCYTILDHIWR